MAAADPLVLMRPVLSLDGDSIVLGSRRIPWADVEGVAIVGAGKAATRMSAAVEKVLGRRRLRAKKIESWVNVPAGTPSSRGLIHRHVAGRSHENRPTAAGIRGTRSIVAILDRQGPRDLAICLFSGGGSALMPALPPGVNLRDLRQVTARLHAAGASIEEVNAVRKHLSTVSGGGLVRRWHGGWLTAFLLSDVVGDARDVIASGPTSVDPTTFRQAVAVLQRHRLWSNAPASVRRHLLEGLDGRREETLKRLPPEVDNVVIGGPRSALTGASRMAERLGYQVRDVSHLLVGEASNAGRRLARTVRVARDEATHRRRPLCLLAAGETTVRLGPGAGRGGRAQELVLAAFAALGGDLHDIVILAGGTDGEDGPTDAAGAFADERLAGQARLQRRLPGPFLASHDSYRFFDSLGGLLRTGRTGTNVTDLVVVLVG